MNKLIAPVLAGALLTMTATVIATPAEAATPKRYSNCASLNAKYSGGVAKTSHAKNTKTVRGKKVAAKSTRSPKVNRALYERNKHLDRDKDGIACER